MSKVELFQASPTTQEAALGSSSIEIHCFADKELKVTWYKLNGAIKGHTVKPTINSAENTHTLRILEVEEENYGTYVCQQTRDDQPYIYYYSKTVITRTGNKMEWFYHI